MTRKKRPHGPGWITPKAIKAGIQAELVPAALALGWVPRADRPARRGRGVYNELEFQRRGPDRIERIGLDFEYGKRPDVGMTIAVWTGANGACTRFESGNCWNKDLYLTPWLWVWELIRRKPSPEERLAEVLATGRRRLQIVERYLREGVKHPDLWIFPTEPPHRWPDDAALAEDVAGGG